MFSKVIHTYTMQCLSTLLLYGLFGGCGGGAKSTASSAHSVNAPSHNMNAPVEPDKGDAVIQRSELVPVLEKGLGYFLQELDVEPFMSGGKFAGFRIRAIHPKQVPALSKYLSEGDIISTVNGLPIEKPEEATRIWRSLRVVSALVIEGTRNKEPLKLRFVIINEDG